MSTILEVKNLSKMYTIRHEKARYKSLRDDVVAFAKNPFSALRQDREKFFALKNVSFSLQKGETLGIIGPNGAGKSTLLKILTRVTPPTKGEVRLRGRVASLLEVGTGFHPELTGRENIFLSGAVLGMRQKEIKRKFDEIIDFAGVEKFLDTPVKFYSSGMYTRLAFSVAAFLDPDIFLVDEVLAVGDAAFQKKCLGKMEEAGKEGRTVIFVSHNMTAVNSLCKKVMLLKNGKIVDIGRTSKLIEKYLLKAMMSTGFVNLRDSKIKKHTIEASRFSFTSIEIVNSKGLRSGEINLFEPFSIKITGRAVRSLEEFSVGFSITTTTGVTLFNSYTSDVPLPTHYDKGTLQFTIDLKKNFIAPGVYIIDLVANGMGVNEWIPEAITLHIQDKAVNSRTTLRPTFAGLLVYPKKWQFKNTKK